MEVQKINKPVCNILATGSEGNCVMLFNSILVDVGVPFSLIEPFAKELKLITWSHQHKDHFNLSTIRRLIKLRPTLRIAICEHEYERAVQTGCKNIDVLSHGKWYDYKEFKIATFKTYHDVESNGYRFEKNGYKVFFATDTEHLEGITAKGYDLYAIEHNYNEEVILENIENDLREGRYSYAIGAINSHLSEQQASDFIFKNKGDECEILRLHESKHNI